MTILRSWNFRRQWPLVALVVLGILFSLMLTFSRKAPIIASIEPSMAAPGEAVTLVGDYFGRTSREGQLTMGGVTPPPSLIREWSDQRIVFVVPDDAPSGLVTVANSQGVSDSVLFTNTLTIPTVLKTRVVQSTLEVTSIVPSVPVPGQVVTITGRGMGRGAAGSWLELLASSAPGEPLSSKLFPSQTRLWSDQQVAFVLPSGWGLSSVVVVHTARGISPPIPLQSIGPVSFEGAREVTLNWGYELEVQKGKGSLNLIFPEPDPRLSTSWTDGGGDSLRWENPSRGVLKGEHRVRVMVVTKTWNGFAAGQIVPAGVAVPPEEVPALGAAWKPAQTTLKTLSAKWNLEAADPFVRVRRLVESLRATYRQGPAGGGQAASLESVPTPAAVASGARLSPLGAAGVMVLTAQQAGLSARLVRGFLVEGSTATSHVWAQIWIPGAAWVDYDPWLLLGLPEDQWESTLGSLDSRHVAWSLSPRAETRQLAQSVALRAETSYAGLTLVAETSGDLVVSAPVWKVSPGDGVKGR